MAAGASSATPSADGAFGADALSPERRRWLYLAILFLVGASSSLDRVIISVLLEPIKAEFGVSDTMLGLLGGFSFAIFYAALGIPIARLADRGDRKCIITVALTVWSLMTALCGLAASFWQLLLTRVGVGAGEAGATPPSQSLIVDYFPPHQRARAIALFGTSGTAGYILGLSVGSQVVVEHGWRVTLFAVGLPGLLIAALVHFVLKEPRRAGQHRDGPIVEPLRVTLGHLLAKRSYRLFLIGFTIYHFVAYGSLVFVPSYLIRVVKVPIDEAGFWYGLTTAAAVVTGGLLGGFAADKLGQRRQRWLAWIPALAFLLAAPASIAMFLIDDLSAFLIVSTVSSIFLNAAVPATFLAAHAVCGTPRRAMAIAIILLFGNLFGFGLGPVMTGALSDYFTAQVGADGLRYALMFMMGLLLPTAGLIFLGSRSFEADLEA